MASLGRLLYLFRRDIKRGWKASRAFYKTAPRIWDCAPTRISPAPADSPAVHLLTGEENATMTAWMLASWEHCTDRSWDIRIHDDGSLSSENSDRLRKRFPNAEVIGVQEADAKIEPLLAGYPRCQAYRERHPLARKCFDIPALSPTRRFLLLDSDVLFFTRPDTLLDWVDTEDDLSCWFNADPQEPSPIPPEEAEDEWGQELWPRVNSGLCLLQKEVADFEHFESYLASDRLREGNPWRIEQTLLALGASRLGKGGTLSEEQYQVTLERDRHPDSVARHYVGAVRDHFYQEGIISLAPTLLRSDV